MSMSRLAPFSTRARTDDRLASGESLRLAAQAVVSDRRSKATEMADRMDDLRKERGDLL
jgi:hypothetical protein